LLALELLHHRLHPGAPRADAGAYRIHVGLVGPNGDLGAVSGFPGYGFNLHDAVVDLGHFQLKQALEQPGVGAGNHHLGAFGRLADLGDVHLDTGARLVGLARHLLAGHQHRLDAAQVDDDVAMILALHDAGDDVADAVGVLLIAEGALGLADALPHHLLGGLRGDAAEIPRRNLDLDHVVELVVGVDALGFG